MGMGLAGRAALVTGGSRRIGKVIALALARAGADVAIGYRADAHAARRTVASIETLGRHAIAVRADLTTARNVDGSSRRRSGGSAESTSWSTT